MTLPPNDKIDQRRTETKGVRKLTQFALTDRSFPLAGAAAALKYMCVNAHFGKIVLTA